MAGQRADNFPVSADDITQIRQSQEMNHDRGYDDAARLRHAGFEGDFSWAGYWNTYWFASPRTGIVAVILTCLAPSPDFKPGSMEPDFDNMLFASLILIASPTKVR